LNGSYCCGSDMYVLLANVSYGEIESYTEVIMSLESPPAPQAPNISSTFSIHSYLWPNYAYSAYCYPATLEVQYSGSGPEYNGSNNWTYTYFFTWIWQNTEGCEALYPENEDYVNVTCNSEGYGCQWVNENYNMSGLWYPENDTLIVAVDNEYSGYYSFNMIPAVPAGPPIAGTWNLNSYVSPPYYVDQSCYPESLEIENSGLSPQDWDGDWVYQYEFIWTFPCSESCENADYCGSYYQAMNVTSNADDMNIVYFYDSNGTEGFTGAWFAANNSFVVNQVSNGSGLYVYAMVQMNTTSYLE